MPQLHCTDRRLLDETLDFAVAERGYLAAQRARAGANKAAFVANRRRSECRRAAVFRRRLLLSGLDAESFASVEVGQELQRCNAEPDNKKDNKKCASPKDRETLARIAFLGLEAHNIDAGDGNILAGTRSADERTFSVIVDPVSDEAAAALKTMAAPLSLASLDRTYEVANLGVPSSVTAGPFLSTLEATEDGSFGILPGNAEGRPVPDSIKATLFAELDALCGGAGGAGGGGGGGATSEKKWAWQEGVDPFRDSPVQEAIVAAFQKAKSPAPPAPPTTEEGFSCEFPADSHGGKQRYISCVEDLRINEGDNVVLSGFSIPPDTPAEGEDVKAGHPLHGKKYNLMSDAVLGSLGPDAFADGAKVVLREFKWAKRLRACPTPDATWTPLREDCALCVSESKTMDKASCEDATGGKCVWRSAGKGKRSGQNKQCIPDDRRDDYSRSRGGRGRNNNKKKNNNKCDQLVWQEVTNKKTGGPVGEGVVVPRKSVYAPAPGGLAVRVTAGHFLPQKLRKDKFSLCDESQSNFILFVDMAGAEGSGHVPIGAPYSVLPAGERAFSTRCKAPEAEAPADASWLTCLRRPPEGKVCNYLHDVADKGLMSGVAGLFSSKDKTDKGRRHGFPHQYFKHDTSVNCYELPPMSERKRHGADPVRTLVGDGSGGGGDATTESAYVAEREQDALLRKAYLASGCLPFAGAAARLNERMRCLHDELELVRKGDAGEGKARLAAQFFVDDILQRALKYSFSPDDLNDDAVGWETLDTSKQMARLAASNVQVAEKLLVYFAKKGCSEGRDEIAKAAAEGGGIPATEGGPMMGTSWGEVLGRSLVSKCFPGLHVTEAGGGDQCTCASPDCAQCQVKCKGAWLAKDVKKSSDIVKTRDTLKCVPGQWGRSGFAIGGVRNDGKTMSGNKGGRLFGSTDYARPLGLALGERHGKLMPIDVLSALRNNARLNDVSSHNRFACEIGNEAEKETGLVCEESCSKRSQVHPACSRLAANEMSFWVVKRYDQGRGFLNKLFESSADKCLARRDAAAKHSNCWGYANCMEQVVSGGACKHAFGDARCCPEGATTLPFSDIDPEEDYMPVHGEVLVGDHAGQGASNPLDVTLL
jgi:hypothetical protein